MSAEDKGTSKKKMTPADTLLWRALAYKWKRFSQMRKLAPDGSFYYDDVRLARENGVCSKTIMRSRKRLQAQGKIKFQSGKFKGQATKYWVLAKPDFMSAFIPGAKRDSESGKTDFMSAKDRQNVIPNNLSNKFKKKDFFPTEEMTDSQREEMHQGVQAFLKQLSLKK